jgi:hypothetical protein
MVVGGAPPPPPPPRPTAVLSDYENMFTHSVSVVSGCRWLLIQNGVVLLDEYSNNHFCAYALIQGGVLVGPPACNIPHLGK